MGLSGSYPLHPDDKKLADKWRKKFNCANAEDYSISGNFDTAAGKQFTVGFKMCDPTTADCYDEATIKDWLLD